MLIASPRHRPADLELWRELEAADLLHGERLEKSGRVDRAIDELRQFAAAGDCYAGFSGGKDSTVVAHLIHRAGLSIPVRHVRALPVANPDTQQVIATLRRCCPGLDIAEQVIQYTHVTPYEDDPNIDRQFFGAFRIWGSRHISGVRSAESGVRAIRMRRWGLSTANTCAPIGWWSAQDVFGYLAYHGLPVHPAYAMLGGGRWRREWIRVDELAGPGGSRGGRREWEREYYGDVLRRLGV